MLLSYRRIKLHPVLRSRQFRNSIMTQLSAYEHLILDLYAGVYTLSNKTILKTPVNWEIICWMDTDLTPWMYTRSWIYHHYANFPMVWVNQVQKTGHAIPPSTKMDWYIPWTCGKKGPKFEPTCFYWIRVYIKIAESKDSYPEWVVKSEWRVK